MYLLDSLQTKERKYYVYRFLNKDKVIIYLANNFYPTTTQNNFEITENQYALTELLQFMFKSALSKGKEVWIYVPNERMRNLLKDWVEKDLK